MVIIAAVDHEQRKGLYTLLILTLGETDVRQLVRYLPDGAAMHAELPGAGVSLDHLVSEAVSVLERHGRLDEDFFAALIEKRPGRRAEIEALAASMPGPANPATAAPDEWLLELPEPLHDRLVGRQRELDRLDGAWRDAGTRVLSVVAWGGAGKLSEVEDVAERSGMRLLACDAHLERARLTLAAGDAAAARTHANAARVIVAETGYHRRDRELAALADALSRTH